MARTTAPSGFSPPAWPLRAPAPEKIRRCGPAAYAADVGVKSTRVQGGRGRLARTWAGTSPARDDATTWPAGLTTAMAGIAVGRRHARSVRPATPRSPSPDSTARGGGRARRKHLARSARRASSRARHTRARTVVGERGQPRVPVLEGDPALVGDVAPREARPPRRCPRGRPSGTPQWAKHVSAWALRRHACRRGRRPCAAHCGAEGPPVSRRGPEAFTSARPVAHLEVHAAAGGAERAMRHAGRPHRDHPRPIRGAADLAGARDDEISSQKSWATTASFPAPGSKRSKRVVAPRPRRPRAPAPRRPRDSRRRAARERRTGRRTRALASFSRHSSVPCREPSPTGGTMMRIAAIIVFTLTALVTGASAQEPYPSRPISDREPVPARRHRRPHRPPARRVLRAPAQAAGGHRQQGGAAGAVGAQFASVAKPDGYTLLIALVSISSTPERCDALRPARHLTRATSSSASPGSTPIRPSWP